MTRNLPALGPFKHPDFITKARLTELEARLALIIHQAPRNGDYWWRSHGESARRLCSGLLVGAFVKRVGFSGALGAFESRFGHASAEFVMVSR